MTNVHVLLEETPAGDRYVLAVFAHAGAANKERDSRQTRLDAVGVLKGAAEVSKYVVEAFPLEGA